MRAYKSNNITVLNLKRENNGIFTVISFYTSSQEEEKTIVVHTNIVESYFIETHKHLGINSTNVKDFLTDKDPKYKVEIEDVEKFLDKYLYDGIPQTID